MWEGRGERKSYWPASRRSPIVLTGHTPLPSCQDDLADDVFELLNDDNDDDMDTDGDDDKDD